MVPITLKCSTCGEEKDIYISNSITFGFELYDIAKKAGWYPVIDMNYSRTLVFCCKDCMKKQLTKGGYIRKNLIKAEKNKTEDKTA